MNDETTTMRSLLGSQEDTANRLRLLIERIENLTAEKQGIADDIKDVYSEAKSAGFDPKAMKEVIKLRKKEKAEREAEEAMVELYKDALGL